MKPNAWKLYNILGNVAEWILDHYFVYRYGQMEGEELVNPWSEPQALDPRSVRGGSYDDDRDKLRCALRISSNPTNGNNGIHRFLKASGVILIHLLSDLDLFDHLKNEPGRYRHVQSN